MAFTHGTRYGYAVRGCRCGECRAWEAARLRAYRAARSARDPGFWRRRHAATRREALTEYLDRQDQEPPGRHGAAPANRRNTA